MADIKQLKIKIQSTKNIRKITNAMEVISTIKLQKVKKKAEHLREYMNTFLGMLASVDGYVSLFPKAKANVHTKELAILISSEKWLCGSLNTILFKQFAAEYDDKQDSIEVFTIGKKAKEYCTRRGYVIVWSLSLPDTFESDTLQPLYDYIDSAWVGDRYAKMRVWYNYFKNTMKQIPVWFQLSPLSVESFNDFMNTLDIVLPKKSSLKKYNSTDMVLEPNRETIVKKAYDIMMNVIVYGAVLHNKTGEFASRMMAMKWAKDNATKITADLTLAYNKARQDAITKEVLEIVSAKAVIED
jgi:F-type H+-transporting ATPase subunit gamma